MLHEEVGFNSLLVNCQQISRFHLVYYYVSLSQGIYVENLISYRLTTNPPLRPQKLQVLTRYEEHRRSLSICARYWIFDGLS